MKKIERLIQRPDGSEVKIVARAMYGSGLERSIDVYVVYRQSPNHEWESAGSTHKYKDWRNLPLGFYKKYGRVPMLQVASPGEILSVMNEAHKECA